MLRPRLPVALLLAALGAASLTACNPATPFAAIVNGHRISQAQLSRELRAFAANTGFVTQYDQSAAQQQPPRPGILDSTTAHQTFTQAFADTVLALDIQAEVIHAEVVKRHIEPTAATINAKATADAAGQQFGSDASGNSLYSKFSPWLRHVFNQRQAEVDALGRSLPQAPVVDAAAIQRFYDANPQDFISKQCASHILVTTRGQADAVEAQLAGGAPFAAVAQQVSTDSTTASKGGDLGCSAPGVGTNPVEQDEAFVRATSSAPLNQVSAPLQLQSGWDVFQVTSRDKQPLTDAVKSAIRSQLQQQSSSPIAQFLQSAAATLKVTVNPQYGRWDPQQLVIVPPATPDPARTGVPNGTATTVPQPALQQPTPTSTP